MKNSTLEELDIYGEGGGGGCFVAGTLVSTPNGNVAIEQLAVGDKVLCYEECVGSQLVEGTITVKHKHPKEDNNSGIYTFGFDDGTVLKATGNHYIMRTDGVFAYAGNFEVGDQMVNADNTIRTITSVKKRPVADGEFVYNLEVTPHHTYIANGIKVHNGGGGSKKGGSTPRAAQEAPNTLASSATAMVVEAISEGEIVGLVAGAQSIYLDGTPVQNSDGTYNFEKFSYEQRVGLPTQPYLSGFPDVESEVDDGREVTASTPRTIVPSTDSVDKDAIRVTMVLTQGLFVQNKENGDITGHSVTLRFDRRLTGGTWAVAKEVTISGKTMTTYEESHRIDRPNPGATGAWEVRVVRLSADEPDSSRRSATSIRSYTLVKDKKLSYPNTAVIGVKIDAKSTGGQVPRRAYRVKGIKVQVPVNYNPTTRVYTGTWNGTFKTAWTDNPAWVVYDILTNDRYGLGSFIEPSMVDKFSFYDVARYNDELVSNGSGGQEPRFTFNAVMNTRQDAWKLIQAVASSCRAVVYYGGGLIRIIQDRPTSTTLIVNKSDVINGMFEYSSTSMAMRHPVVQVTYNNKNDRFNPATITVEDTEAVDRYGYNVKEMIAYGATTEGQARRLGLWSLYTELGTTESVKFVCGLNLATRIQPGSVIKIVDEEMMGVPFGGRIISGTTSSITLDREVDLIAGQTYKIEWVDVDGITIKAANVTNGVGTHTVINLDIIVPSIMAGRSWVITSNDLTGRLYRIYTVSESGGTQFDVTAFAYDPNKYAEVDQVTNPESWTPIQKTLTYCPSPTNVTWARETSTDSYGRRVVNLRVNWGQEDEQYISNYIIQWRRDGREASTPMVSHYKEFVIPNVVAGTYEIYIWAVNVSNVKSLVKIGSYYNDLSGGISPMVAPINLHVLGGSTTWSGKDLTFEWGQNPGNQNQGDAVFKSYVVELRNPTTNALLRSVETTETQYTYYYDDNVVDTADAPLRNVLVKVFNKDSLNRTSVDVFATFTNPLPSAPTFTVEGGYQYYSVMITPPAGHPDVIGYYVAEVATINTIPVLANIVYDGPNTRVDVGYYDESVTVRVGCYDWFSKDLAGVAWAGGQTAGVTQALEVIDSTEGYKFFSLTFRPNHPAPNSISWTSSTVVKTNSSPLEQKVCPAGNAAWSGTALYLYYNWDTNTIVGTTILNEAVGVGKAVLATYYGGNNVNQSNGDAYIDGNKILAQTVGASQIIAGSITANEIAAQTITGDKIAANNVITTSAQIGNAVIGGVNIANGAITSANLIKTENLITDAIQIESGLINGVHIQNGAITATKIAANTIEAGNLRTDTAVITGSAQIGSGVIGGVNLADEAVTAQKLSAGEIITNTAQIKDAIITSGKIQDLAVTTGKIQDLQVTTLKIGDNAVTATAYYDYVLPVGFRGNNGVYQVLDTINFTGTGNKHQITANINHFVSDGLGFYDPAWGPPTNDYWYITRAFFKMEITHGTSPIVYDLTEFIEIGQSYGTMIKITDDQGVERWMNGGYTKAGQYDGQTLPLRTYPLPDINGTTSSYSTLFPTVNGVAYTMKWYVRIDRTVQSIDQTTNYYPTAGGQINKRLYAITEIKK